MRVNQKQEKQSQNQNTPMDFDEMVTLSRRVHRLERWILELAEKAGVQPKA